MSTRFRLPLILAVIALVAGMPLHAAMESVEFTPQNGFSGGSEGNGTLTVLLGKPRSFHVESRGMTQPDGTFRLQQRISFRGEPPRDRVWILTTVGPNRYSGTLSDAAGPVTGVTSDSTLTLQYRAKGPLFVRQELTLLPDGRTIDNVGVITLFGIPVGHLRETIIRKGAKPQI